MLWIFWPGWQADGTDDTEIRAGNLSPPTTLLDTAPERRGRDAITGQAYTVFIELKDKGVPVNDIAVLTMAVTVIVPPCPGARPPTTSHTN